MDNKLSDPSLFHPHVGSNDNNDPELELERRIKMEILGGSPPTLTSSSSSQHHSNSSSSGGGGNDLIGTVARSLGVSGFAGVSSSPSR